MRISGQRRRFVRIYRCVLSAWHGLTRGGRLGHPIRFTRMAQRRCRRNPSPFLRRASLPAGYRRNLLPCCLRWRKTARRSSIRLAVSRLIGRIERFYRRLVRPRGLLGLGRAAHLPGSIVLLHVDPSRSLVVRMVSFRAARRSPLLLHGIPVRERPFFTREAYRLFSSASGPFAARNA